jgi:lysophospholipase L1-like esterase
MFKAQASRTNQWRRGVYAWTMAVILTGCAGLAAPPSSAPTTPSIAAPSNAPSSEPSLQSTGAELIYVALGDSWPQGDHCAGCRTFAAQYADRIQSLTGRHVSYVDLNGPPATDSATLLASLKTNADVRASVAKADVVLIATGPNEMEPAFEPSKAGTCGGADNADCIRALGATWSKNFDMILTEIRSIRGDRGTAIRLVDAANPFLSVPEMREGLPKNFATTNGALIFALLRDAMCNAAKKHDAVCVDVMPLLNGPNLDQPTDENSPQNHAAIADALAATGLSELSKH